MTMETGISAPGEPRTVPWGSLERGVAGDYELRFDDVLSEAWRLTKGSKGVIVTGIALLMIVSTAFSMLGALIAEPGDDSAGAVMARTLIQLASGIVTYPILAGMQLYAIRRAAGDPAAGFDDITSCFRIALPIFGLYLLQGLLTIAGALLFLLPGLYLAVAYTLAQSLLVERGLGIWEALETSRKAITHRWFLVFGIGLVVGLAVALGALLTLGIGLIWLAPFWMLTIGVLYVRMFGYGGAAPA
jgi:hypothetical protein